jgi:phospholipid/cholesterol/gamma-HCH transport system ATP-binding protein
MIEYRGVCKSFDVPVLTGVDLIVKEGETLSIVGPSGTGKSVLLKTTIALITPDRGEVFIDGQPVYTRQKGVLEAIRRQVRYVFQYAALFDSLNVFENVAMGLPEEAEKSIGRQEVLRRVVASLEMVNLDPHLVLRKLPAELSGGMRKRVGLARAIVAEPRIILYDEPVTGLDPVNAATVNGLITSIAQRTGVTSVVVTHDIEGALEMSDRVALLDRGKLRFIGTPNEFRACPDITVRAFADRKVAAEVAMALANDEELPTTDENGDDA